MTDFKELRTFLIHHLKNNVVPFWIKHAIDRNHGGVYTFLRDDGMLVKRDKSIISNTRALWTFSALANRIEPVEEWRLVADGIYRFLLDHGRDEEGYWKFVVDEQGNTILGEQSIITDAFAIYGLVEYYRLTGKQEALDAAMQTYQLCLKRLSRPGTYKTAPYPTPAGMKAHREAMQFSLMFFELGRELEEGGILKRALHYSEEVLNNFYRKDRQILLEYIGLDNELQDTPQGRTMVPGHAIESLWFQIHIRSSREIGHPDAAQKAAQAMRCCLEKGWDPDFGGIFLGIDVDGKDPPYWKFADTKRWWPACEALCGCLLAYEQTREDWCLEWYWKTHDWAFAHFPDKEHGEWIQNLDREGKPLAKKLRTRELRARELAARSGASEEWINYDLQVKDPYHLPRSLIVAIETLGRLSGPGPSRANVSLTKTAH